MEKVKYFMKIKIFLKGILKMDMKVDKELIVIFMVINLKENID